MQPGIPTMELMEMEAVTFWATVDPRAIREKHFQMIF